MNVTIVWSGDAGIVRVSYGRTRTTKAALTYLSQCARTELGPRDVRVTNIEPGFTETELASHTDNPELSEVLDGILASVGRLTAEEVADVIAYAAGLPRHVNLRQIMVLPTRQT